MVKPTGPPPPGATETPFIGAAPIELPIMGAELGIDIIALDDEMYPPLGLAVAPLGSG